MGCSPSRTSMSTPPDMYSRTKNSASADLSAMASYSLTIWTLVWLFAYFCRRYPHSDDCPSARVNSAATPDAEDLL